MPMSIVDIKEVATAATSSFVYKFPQDALLLSAEVEDATGTPVNISIYLRSVGTHQACSVPISQHYTSKCVSEDLKIPVNGTHELVTTITDTAVGDVLWLKLIFMPSSEVKRMGWWQ